MSAGTCQPGHATVSKDESAGTCQLGHVSRDKSAGTSQPGQVSRDMSARTCQPGHVSRDMSAGTCQPGPVSTACQPIDQEHNSIEMNKKTLDTRLYVYLPFFMSALPILT